MQKTHAETKHKTAIYRHAVMVPASMLTDDGITETIKIDVQRRVNKVVVIDDRRTHARQKIWLILSIKQYTSNVGRILGTVAAFHVQSTCTVVCMCNETVHRFTAVEITPERVSLTLSRWSDAMTSDNQHKLRMPSFIVSSTSSTEHVRDGYDGSEFSTSTSSMRARNSALVGERVTKRCITMSHGIIYFKNSGSTLCYADDMDRTVLKHGTEILGMIKSYDDIHNTFICDILRFCGDK